MRRRACLGLLGAAAARAAPGLRLGGFVVAPLLLGDERAPIDGALPRFLQQAVAPLTALQFDLRPPMTFARAMRSLVDGSLDILLLVSAQQSRREIGLFDWSYLQTRPTLAVREGSGLGELRKLTELRGLRLAWNLHSRLPRELAGLGIHWHSTSSTQWQQVNLRMLAAGRVDAAFFYNDYSPRYWARKLGLPLRLLPLPMPELRMQMAYSLRSPQGWIEEFGRVAAPAFQGPEFRRQVEDYRD